MPSSSRGAWLLAAYDQELDSLVFVKDFVGGSVVLGKNQNDAKLFETENLAQSVAENLNMIHVIPGHDKIQPYRFDPKNKAPTVARS